MLQVHYASQCPQCQPLLSPFLESSKKEPLPSLSQVLTTWNLAGTALPDGGTDRGLRRPPSLEGGGWEEQGGSCPQKSYPACLGFLPEESVPTAAASFAPPPPEPLRGRGPVVPTGEQQCQASQAGSRPRSGAQASGNSHRGFRKLGPGCLSPLPPGYPRDPG